MRVAPAAHPAYHLVGQRIAGFCEGQHVWSLHGYPVAARAPDRRRCADALASRSRARAHGPRGVGALPTTGAASASIGIDTPISGPAADGGGSPRGQRHARAERRARRERPSPAGPRRVRARDRAHQRGKPRQRRAGPRATRTDSGRHPAVRRQSHQRRGGHRAAHRSKPEQRSRLRSVAQQSRTSQGIDRGSGARAMGGDLDVRQVADARAAVRASGRVRAAAGLQPRRGTAIRDDQLRRRPGNTGHRLSQRSRRRLHGAPRTPRAVRVQDEQGRPTTAAFLIHDALGRLYPNVSKRLAPDFFFQPQVYRADGSTIDLPPGSFTIVGLARSGIRRADDAGRGAADAGALVHARRDGSTRRARAGFPATITSTRPAARTTRIRRKACFPRTCGRRSMAKR